MDYANSVPFEIQLNIRDCSWIKINNSNSSVSIPFFLVKFVTTQNSFAIVITDLIRVWFNYCDENALKKEKSLYLPQFEHKSSSELLSFLKSQIQTPFSNPNPNINNNNQSNLKSQPNHSFSIDPESNELKFTIGSFLELAVNEYIPFNWTIKCNKMKSTLSPIYSIKPTNNSSLLESSKQTSYEPPTNSNELIRDQLILPMFGTINALVGQLDEFKNGCIQRDEELHQYRELLSNSVQRGKKPPPLFNILTYEPEALNSKKLQDDLKSGSTIASKINPKNKTDSQSKEFQFPFELSFISNMYPIFMKLQDESIKEDFEKKRKEKSNNDENFDDDVETGKILELLEEDENGERPKKHSRKETSNSTQQQQETITIDSQTIISPVGNSNKYNYKETDEEKKIREDLEKSLEEKKKKKGEKEKKQKIKKAFY